MDAKLLINAPGHMSAWLLLVAMWANGCGGAVDDRRAIEGNVTLDGQPVANGSIRFEPLAEATAGAGAAIVDGMYRVPGEHGLPPGTYRVSISSPKPAGRAEKPLMANEAPLAEETIPARYNAESELEIKIDASGKTEFNFELSSSDDAVEKVG